jgi:hypothetical protein
MFMAFKDRILVKIKFTLVIFNDCSRKCEREIIFVDYSRTSQETQTIAVCPVS